MRTMGTKCVAWAVVVLTIAAAQGAEFGGFAPEMVFHVGDFPNEVRAADFNGDGLLDLASCNADGDDMSVLIGHGDGTFDPAVSYPAAPRPLSIRAGDFDGDGDVDLTVMAGNSKHIFVYSGNGDGTFVTHQDYHIDPNEPPYVGSLMAHTMADFDGDGDSDIAVISLTTNTVMILPNDGSGTFGPHSVIDYPPNPWSFPDDLEAGDFDNDGDVDLVLVRGYFFAHGPARVLLNNGDATSWVALEFDAEADGIIDPPADLNGDGILDLVLTRTQDPGGYMLVTLGNGDGTFGTQTAYPLGYTVKMTAADLDGDGNIDLITPNYGDSKSVSVFLGYGDGAFAAPLIVPLGKKNAWAVAAADVNDDTWPDIVCVHSGSNGRGWVGTLLNQTQFVLPLDIKPGSCPNPLNRGSLGVLPVAVLGTMDFDATNIDPDTVLIARADGVGGAVGPHKVAYEDVGTPFEGEPCDCHDLEGDGIVDLKLKFRTPDVVDVLELNGFSHGDVVELVVSGAFTDGAPFEAYDCIKTVGMNVRTITQMRSSGSSAGLPNANAPAVPR